MPEGLEAAKAAAARHAVAQLGSGLRIALGTGSTAAHAVHALAERFAGSPVECVASSVATEELARSLGVTVRPLRGSDRFDVMLDGADEVDPGLRLTKGGGGALLREKLLAGLSDRLVILVDPSKLVDHLGTRNPIPVEVVPFARRTLETAFAREGYAVHVRMSPQGRPWLTDNGNEILDLRPPGPLTDPVRVAAALRAHTGVVETGLFVEFAPKVVVGHPDGRVEERSR